MLDIVRLPADDLEDVVLATAGKLGLQPAIVEKDLWVCYLLDYLFQRSEFASGIVFKGGTSLSKAYGLINRFSEDVDLIIDWRLLGYGLNEPWEPRSNSAQERFKKEAAERTEHFLGEVFAPAIRDGISAELGFEADMRLGSDAETVVFAYPKRHSSAATLEAVRLEIGPLAAWSPSAPATIAPYVAEVYPRAFPTARTSVKTVKPERTFWEKATILHQEANRPEAKALPRRYSRHYYDMYQLGHSPVLEAALAQPALLERVVEFKERFYRTPWARLSEAKPGSLCLVPPAGRQVELRRDYAAMRPMLFGKCPSFDEVIAYTAELEQRINSNDC